MNNIKANGNFVQKIGDSKRTVANLQRRICMRLRKDQNKRKEDLVELRGFNV
ncbi:hypothetical protein [Psychrobacillus sp. NPDC096389]|uniref:hypothetical protein n=1 Tax=Psychrobacillus sp. NPDC096389 TaxID=3364490 RepID=UPI00380FD168